MAVTHSLSLTAASSQYAYVNNNLGINFSGNVTIETWANFDSFVGDVLNRPALVSLYDDTAKVDYRIYGYTGGNVGIARHKPNVAWDNPTQTICASGQWYHFALVYNGTTLYFYVNGELFSQTNVSGSGTGTFTTRFTTGVGTNTGTGYHNGKTRNMRVWNVARTQDQIRTDMNVDTPSVTTGLVSNWLLNNDYVDAVSAYNLTASGSPTFATVYPDALDLTENGVYTKKHKIVVQNGQVAGSADLTDVPIVLTESNFLTDAFDNSQGQEIYTNSLLADTSLQGYWRCENVNDSSSNGYNLTNNGTATFISGKFGNAVNLVSASNQSLTIADALCPDLEISGAQSWVAWFNTNSLVTNNQHIVAKRGADTTFKRIFINTSGIVSFGVSGLTTNQSVSTANAIAINNWYHVVGVYDGSTLKIYINGVLSNSVTASGSATDTNGDFAIGRLGNLGSTNQFNGLIDDVAVFSKALSQTEIEQIYKGGADLRFSTDIDGKIRLAHEVVSWDTGADTGEIWLKANTLSYNADTDIYVHYGNASATAIDENEAFGKHQVWGDDWEGVWHLNEASGTRMDATKNSYDLTDNNTVLSAAGKLGTAADLESSNSESLTIADASCPALEIAGSQTWLAWVKPESLANYMHLFGKRPVGVAAKRIYYGSDGVPVFNLPGLTTAASVNSSVAMSTGTFYFIVGVYDSTNTKLKIWVNDTKTEVTASGSATDTNGVFAIGKEGSENQHFLDGLVDESRIYSGALSDDTVTTLYNNQNSPSTFAIPSAVGGDTSAFFQFM